MDHAVVSRSQSRVGTVVPNADGMFQMELPVFGPDAASPSSKTRTSFRLMLRDSKTGNLVASDLDPETQELRLQGHGLRIRSHYPPDLLFTAADPFVSLTPSKGKVFRSDSGEAISGSYLLLSSETDQARHFDTRTDQKGEYLFGGVPPGKYTVSIYAWFPKRSEVPCQKLPRTKDRGRWRHHGRVAMEESGIHGNR